MFGNLFALYGVYLLGAWASFGQAPPAIVLIEDYRNRLRPVYALANHLAPRCVEGLSSASRDAMVDMLGMVFVWLGQVRRCVPLRYHLRVRPYQESRMLTVIPGHSFFGELQGEDSWSLLVLVYRLLEQQPRNSPQEMALMRSLTPAEQLAGKFTHIEVQLEWIVRLQRLERLTADCLDLTPAQTVALRSPAARISDLILFCWHSPCHTGPRVMQQCSGCHRAYYCSRACSKRWALS